MEHAVLPGLVFHQQIEASRGATQHVADVARGQDHALGFARSPRGVNDGDRVGFGKLGFPLTLAPGCENIRQKDIVEAPDGQACRIPSRNAASPQQIIAGAQSFIMATSSAAACRA